MIYRYFHSFICINILGNQSHVDGRREETKYVEFS